MPRLSVDLSPAQDDLLRELSGQESKAATVRKLIDLAALIKDKTAEGMSFAMLDSDGITHRLLGIDMMLQKVDVTGNRIDEGGPL